jgi:parallel beta-helix repeat protein
MLSRNIISNNDVHAIKLHYSKDNTLVNNNITNTNGTGVDIQIGSDNNKFYHNNFINNTIQAYDEGNNIWNNIYPCGGNYWDNYDEVSEGAFDNKSGPDQNEPNSDGICDLPYNISGDSNQDRYPFIIPDGWLTFLIPDLESEGTLDWRNVIPGETVTDSFTVENVGDFCSLLDWKIIDWPDFGDWTFTPSSGEDLEGSAVVQVSVVVPDEKQQAFSGEVKIVNSEDSGDFVIIPVSISTPKNKAINTPFLRFLESHPHMFPLLRHLLGL